MAGGHMQADSEAQGHSETSLLGMVAMLPWDDRSGLGLPKDAALSQSRAGLQGLSRGSTLCIPAGPMGLSTGPWSVCSRTMTAQTSKHLPSLPFTGFSDGRSRRGQVETISE